LFEENEGEGHCKLLKKLIGLIVLINSFPTVGGTPHGSSWLQIYALFKMKPQIWLTSP
jgi:hypothetical protein